MLANTYMYNVHKSIQVFISPVVNPPIIINVTLNQNLDISQTAMFKCNAAGYNISYYWTIGSGSFPSKVTGMNSNTLIIPHLRSSDDNLYTCEASNIGGQVNRSKQLIVTGIDMIIELTILAILNIFYRFAKSYC